MLLPRFTLNNDDTKHRKTCRPDSKSTTYFLDVPIEHFLLGALAYSVAQNVLLNIEGAAFFTFLKNKIKST